MSVVLAILGTLLLLVIILLFMNVSLVVDYNVDLSVRIRALFVSLDAFALAERFSKKEKKDIPDTEKRRDDVDEKKKRRFHLRSPDDVYEMLSRVLELIGALARELGRYLRIKICRLSVRVASPDASKTALLYGSVSGAVYTFIELLSSVMRVKKSREGISVVPDFASDSGSVSLKIVFKVRPIHVIFVLSHLLPILMKGRSTK